MLSCVSRVSSEPCECDEDRDAIDSCVRWRCECRRDDDASVDVEAILALSRRRTIAAEFGRGAGGWLPTKLLINCSGILGLGGMSGGRLIGAFCDGEPDTLVFRVRKVAADGVSGAGTAPAFPPPVVADFHLRMDLRALFRSFSASGGLGAVLVFVFVDDGGLKDAADGGRELGRLKEDATDGARPRVGYGDSWSQCSPSTDCFRDDGPALAATIGALFIDWSIGTFRGGGSGWSCGGRGDGD